MSKTSGRKRPGVDIDPVRPQIGHAYRRVAVDNKPAAYRFMVLQQLAEIGIEPDVLLGPKRRVSEISAHRASIDLSK
jgi:hypothetical protein